MNHRWGAIHVPPFLDVDFFAASSDTGIKSKRELALFDLRTMAKTQSVFLSGYGGLAGIAMSPDGKKLAITHGTGGTRVFDCHDLTLRKYVATLEQRSGEAVELRPIAFDPTSRLIAVGSLDGRVELRTL
jgi:WD40 repeat protein